MQTKNTKQGGFTLVEIAIVLVIIGLLLGGILKGQELINNAKVRSVADRQNSLKAAWFGFIDRYNFVPGDSRRAVSLVPGASARSASTSEPIPGDGRLTLGESVLAMQHLTGAGFLRCPQCNGGDNQLTANDFPDAENSLVNQYSGVMSIWNDGVFSASRGGAPQASGRLQIHSGSQIPSNILSEVDRKIDDGIANSGDMVWSGFDPLTSAGGRSPVSIGNTGVSYSNPPTTGDPSGEQCMNTLDANLEWASNADNIYADVEYVWRSADNPGGAVWNNCGAAVYI